ncbi:hypothetical protein QTP88_012915 [Uroleucon formosanum]
MKMTVAFAAPLSLAGARLPVSHPNCVIYTKYAICSQPLFSAAAGSRGETAAAASDRRRPKKKLQRSQVPLRKGPRKVMAIIRKTNFAFPLGVCVVKGWLVRAACRVGDGRVVELFTALQIDIAVSEPFAEFLMKTYVANERRYNVKTIVCLQYRVKFEGPMEGSAIIEIGGAKNRKLQARPREEIGRCVFNRGRCKRTGEWTGSWAVVFERESGGNIIMATTWAKPAWVQLNDASSPFSPLFFRVISPAPCNPYALTFYITYSRSPTPFRLHTLTTVGIHNCFFFSYSFVFLHYPSFLLLLVNGAVGFN